MAFDVERLPLPNAHCAEVGRSGVGGGGGGGGGGQDNPVLLTDIQYLGRIDSAKDFIMEIL